MLPQAVAAIPAAAAQAPERASGSTDVTEIAPRPNIPHAAALPPPNPARPVSRKLETAARAPHANPLASATATAIEQLALGHHREALAAYLQLAAAGPNDPPTPRSLASSSTNSDALHARRRRVRPRLPGGLHLTRRSPVPHALRSAPVRDARRHRLSRTARYVKRRLPSNCTRRRASDAPVSDVRFWAERRDLGVTDEHGILRVQLTGREGLTLSLTAACPPEYRTAEPQRQLRLQRLRSADPPNRPATHDALRSDASARSPSSSARVARPSEAFRSTPAGQLVGQTEADGTAHLLIRSRPHASLRIALDTTANRMIPPDPVHTFQLQDQDDVLFVDQWFKPHPGPYHPNHAHPNVHPNPHPCRTTLVSSRPEIALSIVDVVVDLDGDGDVNDLPEKAVTRRRRRQGQRPRQRSRQTGISGRN